MNRLKALTALSLLTTVAAGSSACASTKTAGQQTDDFVLSQRVGRRLCSDPDVPRFKIEIDANDGVVTLRGVVDDLSTAQEAVRVTQHTKGVEKVVNQLEVKQCEQVKAEDLGLRSLVRTKLSEAAIGVDVVDGVVYLSGAVRDEQTKRAAERAVVNVEGVVRVENQLEVSNAGE